MIDSSVKIFLVVLLLLGIFLGTYEGIWERGAKKVTNDKLSTQQKEPGIYVEVIWDASGSMWGREFGVEKILRSKEVLKTFSSKVPEQINLGLRIFGARKPGDLNDSFLAVPFQEKNRDEILNFVANVKPLGKSPIGYSIKEAVKDLNIVEAKKYILLVSDGIDNGDIPSSEVIQDLKNREIVLHIIHVGDLEDEELKAELKEMANFTGGDYFTYNEHDKVIPTFSQ